MKVDQNEKKTTRVFFLYKYRKFWSFFLEFKLERKSFILKVCCLIHRENQSKKILHFKMSYTLKCKIWNIRIQQQLILTALIFQCQDTVKWCSETPRIPAFPNFHLAPKINLIGIHRNYYGPTMFMILRDNTRYQMRIFRFM